MTPSIRSTVIVFASRLSEPNYASTFAVDASSLTDSEDTIDALFDKAQELDSSFCLFKVDTRDERWMGNYLEGNLGNRMKTLCHHLLPVGLNTTKCYSLNHVGCLNTTKCYSLNHVG